MSYKCSRVSRLFKWVLNSPWSFENYLIFFFSLLLSPSWEEERERKETGGRTSKSYLWNTSTRLILSERGETMRRNGGRSFFSLSFFLYNTRAVHRLFVALFKCWEGDERGKKSKLKKKKKKRPKDSGSWNLRFQNFNQKPNEDPTYLHPASIPLMSWI